MARSTPVLSRAPTATPPRSRVSTTFCLRLDRSGALSLLVAVAALLFAFPAWALTEGALRGTVFDEDQLPIPGVTITISSEALIGGAQERPSNANGEYSFAQLPPGSYQLTATKAGFRSVTVTDIVVKVNLTTTQNLTMPIGSNVQEITVEAEAKAVNVEDTTRGEVLTKEFLQRIPAGRSYQSAVQMAAGVLPGSGGNPNMGGGAYNENTYMLDGANITDPVTGTFSLNFNYDAIQQIQVLLGGYEPEYGVSLGGVVNLVTETGTNNLEFDTSAFYANGDLRPRMDARFTADGFQLAPTGFDDTFQLIQVAAKVSGPIIRDKAWFIVSYQGSRTLISNVGVDLPRDFDGHYVLGKLTVQPSSEHRLSAFVQLDPTSIDNVSQGGGAQFIKPEAQGRQAQGGYATQGRWQWFLSPDANVDTQVVVQKSYIEVNAVPCTHDRSKGYHPCEPGEEQGEVDWETPGRVGIYGAYDSVNWGYFYFDDRFRYQASSKLSLLSVDDPLGGTHDFKFGVEAIQTVWDQIQGYSGNTLFYDLNEVGYDPQTFTNYGWLEITGPIKFRTSGSQWNVFVQDAWKPRPNLTVKYGTRFDNSVMRNDLGEPVVKGNLWGPRLYVAWDPFGQQKTKIGGGFGRFNDTGRLAVSSFTSKSGYGSKFYLGEYFDDGQGQGFLNGQQLMQDYTPNVNNNVALDKLKMPRVDELLLLFQHEVIEDVALGANLTGKFTRYMYEPDELNLIYDEDGSGVIGTRYGDPFYNAARLRTPALAMRDYYQADIYLDKVLSNRWFGRVTYTFTQSLGSSDQAISGSFMNDPQTQHNYGRMNTDLAHVVKAFGSWQLPTDPWDQTLGFAFTYWSGQPLERLYYSETAHGPYGEFGNSNQSLRVRDRGIYSRFPDVWSLDVKFTQALDVRKGRILLDFEAQNVFNARAPDNVSAAFYTENRLFIYSRQDPLRLQFGARYQF